MSVWLWHHPATQVPDGVLLGWQDPPLRDRETAKQDALALAPRLEGATAIWSSDLKRARHAARPLAKALGLTLQVTAALRDIDYGAWNGLTWKQVEAQDPLVMQAYINGFPHGPAPGGESFQSVIDRLQPWWESVLVASEGDEMGPGDDTVVIVSHGVTLRALSALLCGWTREEAMSLTLARGHVARIE